MNTPHQNPKVLYQRTKVETSGTNGTLKVQGWKWWRLVSVTFTQDNGGNVVTADAVVLVKDTSNRVIGCAGAPGIIPSANSCFVDSGVSLSPAAATNAGGAALFGIPDKTYDVDGTITVQPQPTGVMSDLFVIIQGERAI